VVGHFLAADQRGLDGLRSGSEKMLRKIERIQIGVDRDFDPPNPRRKSAGKKV
jgi:hypothetical protein